MFSGRVTWRRLSWVGLIGIVTSLIVNLIICFVGQSLFHVSPSFVPLSVGPVAFWSIVTGIGAVVTFYFIGRYSRHPALIYLIVAICVYLVLFIPDYEVLFSGLFPGADFYSVMTLLSMHVVEACIMICILLMLGFVRDDNNKKKKKKLTTQTK